MTDLDRAANLLRDGKLVAFPTETVYGLGADARNPDAVRRIFAAKGRPATNPLIVHVSGVAMAKLYAARWPMPARRLGMAFWPGPLTIVLPKAKTICPEATAGGDTVGLRVPDHPLAIALIRKFDGPVAAPSANRSNRVSPTTARHVRDELGDAVDLVLDGGPCRVGIESTVVDVSRPRAVILRPGGVSRERIERVIGPVDVFDGIAPADARADSPGQQAVHYAPSSPAFRVNAGDLPRAPVPGHAYVALGTGRSPRRSGATVEMPRDPAAYAEHLYAVLRDLDASRPAAIVVELPPDSPEWHAVRDRIVRATRAMGSIP